jgi:hypothetical protein
VAPKNIQAAAIPKRNIASDYVRLASAAGLKTATAVTATMKRRKIIALS